MKTMNFDNWCKRAVKNVAKMSIEQRVVMLDAIMDTLFENIIDIIDDATKEERAALASVEGIFLWWRGHMQTQGLRIINSPQVWLKTRYVQ
jgi:hypothetical protein